MCNESDCSTNKNSDKNIRAMIFVFTQPKKDEHKIMDFWTKQKVEEQKLISELRMNKMGDFSLR